MSGGGTTWTYTYDADGMRTQRTNGTTTYNYVYSGSQLSWMTVGDTELQFTYDASGRPLAVVYNGTVYYYALNLQGDVVAILDMDGDPVVHYTYDAWGNILSSSGSMDTTLGLHNPLRYRGYVYDQETGLYYLQSRYYNPEWGRFINADAFVSTGQGSLGNNMFTYCLNNPVNNSDPGGDIATGGVGLMIGLVIGLVNNVINTIYFEYSDGKSELSSDSYRDESVTRWDKLDYAKQQTGEDHYNINAWRYYSEYTVHEYGWYVTSSAYEKIFQLFRHLLTDLLRQIFIHKRGMKGGM